MIFLNGSKTINVVCIVGPTASGKTALGVSVSKLFGGEVISADSMQIYQGMDVATAKPTYEEMQGVKHHMIGFVPPEKPYSVADYVRDASLAAESVASRNKIPVIVGGTGLYIKSLLENISFSDASCSPEIRREITQLAQNEGIDYMLSYLGSFDPDSAQRLARERNLKRIIRAVEVYKATGKTMTELNIESKRNLSPYSAVKIGLTCRDREKLYQRINRRVDIMLENGLVGEAQSMYERSKLSTCAQAIGCKELFPYFKGEKTLEECVETLKMQTRRYAKRQLTWFRRDEEINWIFTDEYENYEAVAKKAADILVQRGYKCLNRNF